MVYTNVFNSQSLETGPFSRKVQYPQIERAQAGDRRAEDRFIRKNQRLVFKEAKRYRGLVDWDDLVNAGTLGLSIAIQKFDLSRGFQFSTYAVKPIRTEIRQLICEQRGLSREITKHLKKIDEAEQDLELELERKPTLDELAERTGYSHRVITNAWNKARVVDTSSLNVLTGTEQGIECLDFVEDFEQLDSWDFAESINMKDYIAQLPDRESFIVRARRDGHSYREIGTMLKLSGERIRQLYQKALEYLKHLITYGSCLVRFPQPDKTQLIHPEGIEKPTVKRVDASRLGGKIGRAIQKIFKQTNKESHIHEPGELTNAQKHILVCRRRSSRGAANVAGHRLTSENQRCHQLERTQDDWRGHLGFSPVILNIILLPLALVSQSIRGLQDNDRPSERRSIMSSITSGVSKVIEGGYRKEHPRPPN
ncbi:sigma-70 family RNA polymerase sigma factor [Acaryochloris marina]|uniref:RNA polymerase sigma-24 subunit n=1 Tax=Acaryochloris marina (strain MBIC 11017) TaxID=329726 RepID=A8ZQE9_ACAM1|nr:sigma-70 family RNA polymerase sigma factor [Acaryochloris marina]ABW33234.1 RNA polymerase sigma-24 subunit [Acaryochloris marina MBIC11017]